MPSMSAYLAADTANDTIDVISWICIYVYAFRRILGSKAATGGTDLGRQLRSDYSLWLTGHIYESKTSMFYSQAVFRWQKISITAT